MRRSLTTVFCVLLLGLGAASERTGACGSRAPGKDAKAIVVGSEVPNLQATDHRGNALALRGDPALVTLVYFYPKDNTPG